MDKKILVALAICFSISFIFAAYTATDVLGGTQYNIQPNVSHTINITINNTFVDNIQNISQVNISLPTGFSFIPNTNGSNAGNRIQTYDNTTDNVISWANTSMLIPANTSYEFWVDINSTSIGDFNITIMITNLTVVTYKNITILVDGTVPDISASNFSSPSAGGSYSDASGLLLLNISVFDDQNVQAVFFNITNSSGVQNATFTATNSGTSWNISINTTGFADGLYNITAYVNDTAGNLNNTAILSVRFDNTNPTATFSCSPTSTYTGSTVTCTCSGTDSGSGVATTSYTTNPSTTSSGTYTETCTVTDNAGKVFSTTTTYTINTRTSSAASSSSSTWDMTYKPTVTQLENQYTKELKVKEKIEFKVNSESHYMGVKEISGQTATIEIASVPVSITLGIGEDAKIDVNDDDVYDIYVLLNNVLNNKADITMQTISEQIPEGELTPVTTTGEIEEIGEGLEEKDNSWIWWLILGIVIISIVSQTKWAKKFY